MNKQIKQTHQGWRGWWTLLSDETLQQRYDRKLKEKIHALSTIKYLDQELQLMKEEMVRRTNLSFSALGVLGGYSSPSRYLLEGTAACDRLK
jgi:hypothetical protein